MMQDSGNALGEVLLERLQDIHAAPEPSWWPPAPGWWMVAGIALAALVCLLVVFLKKLRVNLRRRRKLRQLDGLARTLDPATRPAEYLAAVNRVFRAIALRAFPGTACARLQGEAWVAFIRQRLAGRCDTSGLEALSAGPYQARPQYDAEKLQAQARAWVMAYG